MLSSVRSAVLDALAVLAPVDCAGCGAADRGLCASCRGAFEALPTRYSLGDGLVVTVALLYAGPVRAALLAYKERGRTNVARALGAALAEALEALDHPEVEFTTVPTSPAAWRRRGYDPVRLACRKAGLRPATVLRHSRRTQSQKTLGERERAANLDHSLVARFPLTGRRFILIDDVVTTGATLLEARRAIREAGGEVVGAAAVAFTPRVFAKS